LISFSIRLLFGGKDDKTYDPIAKSSVSYTFTDDDRDYVSRKFLMKQICSDDNCSCCFLFN